MRELYRKLGALDYGRENELLTVIRGEHTGEKILLTDGKTAWSSGKHAEDLSTFPEDCFYREKLGHVQTLVVCGAGFVGQAVIRLGKFLGWKVISVEDRSEYAHVAEEAGADRVLCGDFSVMLSTISFDEDIFFVVVTREHSYDMACLDVILHHPFGYIGMMGSHKRSAGMREALREAGYPEDLVASIHAPVGLPIKAQTPEEIAVAITAEMILEKEKRSVRNHFPDDILNCILEVYGRQETDPASHAILATITRQTGSTPRRAGAKMLVLPDGSTIDTIGGGSMEAEVIRRSVSALRDPDLFSPYLLTVDLTGRSGAYADMICGGITDIFLELI